jgi:hypothetical protein
MALVTTDVSKERIASIIGMTRIGELGTLAGTSNRCSVPSKRRFLQELHGVISQNMAFLEGRNDGSLEKTA